MLCVVQEQAVGTFFVDFNAEMLIISRFSFSLPKKVTLMVGYRQFIKPLLDDLVMISGILKAHKCASCSSYQSQ